MYIFMTCSLYHSPLWNYLFRLFASSFVLWMAVGLLPKVGDLSGLARLSGAEGSLTLLLAQRYNGFFPLTIFPLGGRGSLWPPEWQDHEGNN